MSHLSSTLVDTTEAALNPDLPIIDAHHHLWDRPNQRYLLDEFLADTTSGHRIVGSVFVQCKAMYREHGPAAMRPVGETEFVNGVAAMSASGMYGSARLCSGIVGYADLRSGSKVGDLLDAHLRAGGERFRGIRQISAWDPDPEAMHAANAPSPGLLADPAFREGFKELAARELSFDAWLLSPQIAELTALARAFPETSIVLDHVGTPIGVGRHREYRQEVLRSWSQDIRELASCGNVTIKLGGLGMGICGLGFANSSLPPSSKDLATAFEPIFETCIQAFSPARCMFESNFPVDNTSFGYVAFWNACKRVATGYTAEEITDLFSGTASRVYRLHAFVDQPI